MVVVVFKFSAFSSVEFHHKTLQAQRGERKAKIETENTEHHVRVEAEYSLKDV